MARPAAVGPIQSNAARQMRHTAGLLDADHPETIAGDHVRDAAKVLEHGSTEGAKRHLDAAMGLLTPQNLVRHGIRDDEGHATAKHHMHQIHRHHLIVQDIEDTRARNEQMREALRASREQIKATTQQAVAGPPQPGHAPPGYQQPSKAVTALAVELAPAWLTERRGLGGKWIGSADAASLHGQVLHGRDRRFRPVHGRYDHATRTITDATRGKVPVSEVAKILPVEKRRRTVLPARYQVAGSLATPTDLSARTAMLERTPAPRGRPGGPGLYRVKGLGHTPYLQQVVKALIEKRGMTPGKAYAIARARIRKWGATSRHPEVRAAATRAEAGEIARQARAHAHANGWAVADVLIELAAEPIDLFNPYHAPTGQFTTAQGTGQGTPKQKRQQLLKRAAGLRSQIRGLETQLHAATAHRKSRSSTPAKKGAAATSAKQAAAAKQRATSSKTAAKKTAAGAKKLSPAEIRAQIADLRGQLQSTLAQLKRL